MEIKYKAPKGLTVKILTSIVLIFYVFIIFKVIHEMLNATKRPVGIIIGFAIFTIIIVISYLLSPKSYILWLTSFDITHPHIVNSTMFKEVDWLMNEEGDVKKILLR